MACYKPLGAVRTKLGKIQFREAIGGEQVIALPCGKCIGCKLEHSRQWALRCVHEARMHEDNNWLTLTYDDENLPYGETLVKEHLSGFIKKLRRYIEPIEIRFFSCGEYGDKKGRPHYHICMFGYQFRDCEYKRTGESGEDVFRSDTLDKWWGKGDCYIGELNFETAAYTARYCCKKISGEKAVEHYTRILMDGRMVEIEPEFALMSKGNRKNGKGGIGKSHFVEYKDEIYPWDECIIRGYQSKPPRYYDRLLEKEDIKTYEKVKKARRIYSEEHKEEETLSRRTQREVVKTAQITRGNLGNLGE